MGKDQNIAIQRIALHSQVSTPKLVDTNWKKLSLSHSRYINKSNKQSFTNLTKFYVFFSCNINSRIMTRPLRSEKFGFILPFNCHLYDQNESERDSTIRSSVIEIRSRLLTCYRRYEKQEAASLFIACTQVLLWYGISSVLIAQRNEKTFSVWWLNYVCSL